MRTPPWSTGHWTTDSRVSTSHRLAAPERPPATRPSPTRGLPCVLAPTSRRPAPPAALSRRHEPRPSPRPIPARPHTNPAPTQTGHAAAGHALRRSERSPSGLVPTYCTARPADSVRGVTVIARETTSNG